MPRIADPRFAPDCTIEVDGQPLPARAGESIAAALVAAGRFLIGRSPKYHRPRGPFCLAGSCHSCIARVDGEPNQRTCRIAVEHGTVVTSQNAVPTARHDLLGTIDHLYPSHLDHHHLFTWNALANRAVVAASRQLAGTGVLPDHASAPGGPPVEEQLDTVVIGSGPAGLGAVEAATGTGRVLLVESERRLGGRLRSGLDSADASASTWADAVIARLRGARGEIATGHGAVGVWPTAGGITLVLQDEARPPALRLVRARSVVLATGSHALPPLFPRNDLPGIFAGRAIARLLLEDGILPGWRCVVAGGRDDRTRISDALERAGVDVVAAPAVVAVEGTARVRHAVLDDGRRIACDALVWCGARGQSWDLPRAAGVPVTPDGASGWRLDADARGGTAVPRLFVAGDVVGPMTIREAIAAGRRAGEAALGHAD